MAGTRYLEICLQGETLYLLPQRAIYWPSQSALLVADLHLGKSGHFQKHGIPIPGEVLFRDLQQLGDLLQDWKPKRLLILGDLFHSRYNQEWEIFSDFLGEFPCQTELIRGNHDVLEQEDYRRAELMVHEASHSIGPFLLQHEPALGESLTMERYVLCGHLHPGIRMIGGGRQSLRFPCFHFGATQGILPAFGQFTGLSIRYPETGDQVYAIVEEEVVSVH